MSTARSFGTRPAACHLPLPARLLHALLPRLRGTQPSRQAPSRGTQLWRHASFPLRLHPTANPANPQTPNPTHPHPTHTPPPGRQDIVYTKLECVGRGGSSKVYKVMAPNRKIFALKRIRLQVRVCARVHLGWG